MMTQQLGFSILTAPLAAIDRRALSQAWYSALHIARTNQPHQTSPDSRARVPARLRTVHRSASPERSQLTRDGTGVAVRSATSKAGAFAAPERRALRSPLARRIERAFLNPVARPKRGTFTIEGTAARVHVALQTTAAGVRIVAVCPASLQDRVARALDEARYALAARGIALQSDVSEA